MNTELVTDAVLTHIDRQDLRPAPRCEPAVTSHDATAATRLCGVHGPSQATPSTGADNSLSGTRLREST